MRYKIIARDNITVGMYDNSVGINWLSLTRSKTLKLKNMHIKHISINSPNAELKNGFVVNATIIIKYVIATNIHPHDA